MKEFFCKECGAVISPSAARKRQLCRSCALKRRSERCAAVWKQMDEDNPIYCEWCGKQIHWNKQRKFQGVRACSRSCQSFLMQSKRKETKEQVENRLLAYIKEQDHYVPLAELRTALHISDKLLYTRNISCVDLNVRAGKRPPTPDNTRSKEELETLYTELLRSKPGITKAEAADQMNVSIGYLEQLGVSSLQLHKELDIKLGKRRTKEETEELIVSWLKTQPIYRVAQDICNALHIDYKCSIQDNGLDVIELNAKAGHSRPTVSYYEDLTDLMLRQSGLKYVRQRTFVGCKDKNVLRYDFWIEDKNVLIEVNGQQHYNEKYPTYEIMKKHDAMKKEFAETYGIPLFVIDATPADTFTERLTELLAKVKGMEQVTAPDAYSIELLGF